MPHIHWVERQNKLEIPKEKDEVNKREVHERNLREKARAEVLKRKKFQLSLFNEI
jgi:hypothetical protein